MRRRCGSGFENEVIFGESDRAEHFFIVASGSIKLYKTSRGGKGASDPGHAAG